MDSSSSDVELRSAGGVVWRSGASGLEVLIIHRQNPAEWRLPKGKLEPGETPEEAAVREVHEETGIQADVEKLLGGPVAGRVHREKGLDAVGFTPSEAALHMLTFDTERNIVRMALDVLGGRYRH